jgi:hypothetical protein
MKFHRVSLTEPIDKDQTSPRKHVDRKGSADYSRSPRVSQCGNPDFVRKTFSTSSRLETARSTGNTIGRLLRERDTVLGRNMFGMIRDSQCRNDCKGFLSFTQWRCVQQNITAARLPGGTGANTSTRSGTERSHCGSGEGAGAEAEAEEEDEEERPDETVQQHVCDLNTVATVSLLETRHETVLPPKPIFRIEYSCAQMWCAPRNSGSNWTTGRNWYYPQSTLL